MKETPVETPADELRRDLDTILEEENEREL